VQPRLESQVRSRYRVIDLAIRWNHPDIEMVIPLTVNVIARVV
jgi:hypothetical protein